MTSDRPNTIDKRPGRFVAICAFLLVAFSVRIFGLGTQSLWYDEAFSVYLCRLDVSAIIDRTAADIHPPLYYFILHLWLQVTGSSEFAVRFLSLFFGVLTVPLLYRLTHQLFASRWMLAPYVVAVLASLSPAYVWYSQEARMYTLTLFLSVLGLYWFARLVCHDSSGTAPRVATRVRPSPRPSSYKGEGEGVSPLPPSFLWKEEMFRARAFQPVFRAAVSHPSLEGPPKMKTPEREKTRPLSRPSADGCPLGAERVRVRASQAVLKAVAARFGNSGQRTTAFAYALFAIANIAAAYAHFYALFVVAAEAIFALGLLAASIVSARWAGRGEPAILGHDDVETCRGGSRTAPTAIAGDPPLTGNSDKPLGDSRPDSCRWGVPNPFLLVSSFALIGLSYLPWSGFALARFEADKSYYQGTIDLWTILRETFTLFAVGHTAELSSASWGAVGFLAIGALGTGAAVLGAFIRRPDSQSARADLKPAPAVLLVLSIVVPILLLYLISYNRPKFHPRYLLLASPAFYMLVATGLAATLESTLRRRFAHNGRFLLAIPLFLVSSLLVPAFWVQSLGNLYFEGKFWRDDWRAATTYVLEQSEASDAIILISGHAFPAFTYYYPRDNWTPLPDGFTLSTENTLGYNIANSLNRVLKDKERLWVVRWQADVVDPNGYLDRLLAEGARRLPVGQSFAGLDLQLFAIPSGTTFSADPQIPSKVEVSFDDKLKLLGYDYKGAEGGRLASASGSKVPLTLYWQAASPLEADYVVSLRIKDKEGHEWGRIDRRPANYFYPTQRWKPGEIVFGDYDLPLLAGTPAGSYFVEVEVYSRQATGLASLNVLDPLGAPAGNSAALAELQVTKSERPLSIKDLQIPQTHQANFGDVDLAGFEAVAKDRPLQQGAQTRLMLFWKASKRPTKDLNVVIQLAHDSGATFYERRLPLARKDYPTTEWGEGEMVRAQYDLVIPPDAPVGQAQLRVGIADGTALVGEPTVIQKVEIAGRPRQMDVPGNIQRRHEANLGGVVTFLGYDLDKDVAKPGGSVRLTLYWQATGKIDRSLAVFTHLLDSQERMWGQKDSIPAGGASPTTGWVPGEVTKDVYDIPVKSDVPEGNLTIEIGMYDPGTGERLVVDGRDSRILLGQVRVAR